jgi:hypothetical protein
VAHIVAAELRSGLQHEQRQLLDRALRGVGINTYDEYGIPRTTNVGQF